MHEINPRARTNRVGDAREVLLKDAAVRSVHNQHRCLLRVTTDSNLNGARPLNDVRHEVEERDLEKGIEQEA
jgi:hypothetical protein